MVGELDAVIVVTPAEFAVPVIGCAAYTAPLPIPGTYHAYPSMTVRAGGMRA